MPAPIKIIENKTDKMVLISPAEPISWPLGEENTEAISHLLAIHQQCQGVGLAAPQVGLSKQIFVIEITNIQAELRENAQTFPRTVYCNPRYTAIDTQAIHYDLESCFSVRDTAGWVPRYQRILFSAQNEQGEAVEFKAEGFTARVLQHETDHCHGSLITDYLDDSCIQGSPDAMYAKHREMLSEQQKRKLDQLRKMQKSSDNT